MNLHKNTRVTPYARQQIWQLHQTGQWSKSALAIRFHVSRPTIHNIINQARLQVFVPAASTNKRFQTIQFGLKRLAKVEQSIQDRLKREARRYHKSYPGEMLHVDTKRLPAIKGELATAPRQYLFVGIDDYSRELYAAILPDKSQHSATAFLTDTLLAQCPYQIDCVYSDNGTEYKGTESHLFVATLKAQRINQKFTRVARPQTNGKAERVIRTLIEMWHQKHVIKDAQHRQVELVRFINFYNTVKPHKGLNNATPYEILMTYFNQPLIDG